MSASWHRHGGPPGHLHRWCLRSPLGNAVT